MIYPFTCVGNLDWPLDLTFELNQNFKIHKLLKLFDKSLAPALTPLSQHTFLEWGQCRRERFSFKGIFL